MKTFEERIADSVERVPAPTIAQTERARGVFLDAARGPGAASPPPIWRSRRIAVVRVVAVGMLLAAGGIGAGYAIASQTPRIITHTTVRVHTRVVGDSRITNPGFAPEPGWFTVDTRNAQPPQAPTATASNVAFSPEDFHGSSSGVPTHTLIALPAGGIVLQVTFYVRGESAQVDAAFPPATLPFSLSNAIATSPVEGSPMSVGYRRLLVSAGGYDADISIFFGMKTPAQSALKAAQKELDGLILPHR